MSLGQGWQRALAVVLLVVVLLSAAYSAMRLWNEVIFPPPAVSTSAPRVPLLTEEAIAAIAEAPPVQPRTGKDPNVLINTVSLTDFMSTVEESGFTQIYLNTGNSVAAGTATDGGTTTISVAQLTGETTEALMSLTPGNAELQIVDPVKAWEVSSALAPQPTASSQPAWLVPAIVLGLVITITGTLMLVRSRRRSESGASVSVSSGKQGEFAAAASVPPTRFSDVAGCEEAIEDLQEIVDYLRNPEKYSRVGATIPRGALLIGPPGTGKTLLARAVAGEAGVPFYPVAGSDFIERLVGVGASRVRMLFKKARKHQQGAIIFIDEIDAVGRRRNSSVNSHHEQESTLNALLVEMDGFHQDKVIVLAASNRADMLDPALRRPGRLERQVQVPLPDRAGRERVLSVHAAERPLNPAVDLAHVARRTAGMSGAELSRVVNEACIAAAREEAEEVSPRHFEDAIETVALGKARLSAVVTDRDRLITAWHEAGHTVAALTVPDAERPISVSIIPRGHAGGVTWTQQCDDQFLTRAQAHARLTVAMAGRAAEEMLLDGEFTSGPHGDLSAATSLAISMVTRFGMADSRLMVQPEEFLSSGGPVAMETVACVEGMLSDALENARTTLMSNRDLLVAIVDRLLEDESLNASQIEDIEQSIRNGS